MHNNYYFYLSSNDSKDKHPENSPDDFTIELPRSLTLNGDWEFCLKELTSPPASEILYICSDLCVESFACNTSYPILRVVSGGVSKNKRTLTFDDPYYVRVKTDRLGHLRIFIRGADLKPIHFKSGIVTCTLHLKRVLS
jgi:hypothetical protein